MRIRSKLVALIAVPLLAIGLIAFAGFRSQSVTIERAEAADAAIKTNTALDMLVLAIGIERLGMVGAETGMTVEELQAATDEAFTALEAVNTSTRLEAATVDARNLVDASRAGDIAVSAGMSVANQDLLAAAVGSSDDFPTATGYAGAFLNHTAILALESKEAAWAGYLDSSGVSGDSVRNSAQQFGHAGALKAQVEELVAATGTDSFDLVLRSAPIRRLAELEAVALDDLGEGTRQIDEAEVLAALVNFRGEWVSSIGDQGATVAALVDDEVSAANGVRSLFTLLAILGALVMAAVIFVIYRSVTQPLENLTERATIVANDELPELMDLLRYGDDADDLPEATPIPVTSTDEIGELVTAFNDVQLTAYTLASEQAIGRRNVGDMFVNLGRRNQQLLHRILNQLTRLEQKEEDPDTLRELFELDSAVTRMRRNAESLVALAGGQTARQWSKPVSIDNAVRGAFGEVEGYERIDITSLAPAQVQGSVVADLTHLMAELLENAVNFSEPDTIVSVAGFEEGDGYQITILDEGIGMSPAELAENNSRITDPPPLERVPTKFLGLYVVGRLAERHNIGVRLSEAPKRGVMARIDVPAELLGGSRADADADVSEARRSEAASQTSPLEETHDVDAELAAMLPDDAEDALPVRGRGGSAADDAATTDTADTDTADTEVAHDADEQSESEVDEIAETAAAESDAEVAAASTSADADPAPADGGLSVRGRKGGTAVKAEKTTEPEKADKVEQIEPAEETVEPAEESADDARLPVRRAKESSGPLPADDGLPTRGRRKDDKRSRTGKAKKAEQPKSRSSLDQRAATDNSEKSAGDFSSMMSALSGGINRGLTGGDSDGSETGSDSKSDSHSSSNSKDSNSSNTEGSEG